MYYVYLFLLASPFLCAAVALHGDYLATGTADGMVRSAFSACMR